MGKGTNIFFDILDIWVKQNQLYSLMGTIDSVDSSNRTCIVKPNDGSPLLNDVSLEADYNESESKGFYIVPAIGSNVIVTFKSKDYGYLSAWTEIDQVVAKQGEWIFNDGDNLGIVKVQEMSDRLNELEELFTQLQQDIISWTPVTQDGGAALKVVLSAGFGAKQVPTSKTSDFENEFVKH